MRNNVHNRDLKPLLLVTSLSFALLLLSACETQQASNQNVSAKGSDTPAIVTSTQIPAGDPNCPSGGVIVQTGIDNNANGFLDLEEIDSSASQKICNGSNGLGGSDGLNGLNSLISLLQEPAGANCQLGGIKIESGLDVNRNSTLDFNEVNDVEYSCNISTTTVDNGGTIDNGNNVTTDFQQAIYDTQTNDDVVKGGLLYDKWWKVSASAAEPAIGNNHPLWPSANTAIQNSGTWRCKECHGWDYQGRDGAYQSGKHFTGHPGIVNSATAAMTRTTPASLHTFLKTDVAHGFSNNFFTEEEYYDLVKFIMSIRAEAASGVASYDFISPTKQAIGANTINGKNVFETSASCSVCHGLDGKTIDFEDKDINTTPNTFVHNIAQDNPWEFIHKIRFGQPGTAMSGLYNKTTSDRTMQTSIDLLGYAQTSLAPDIKRAGLLYDKWWATSNIQNPVQPTLRNPIWVANPNASQDLNAVSNDTTWRCKTCHGWDYQGVNGAYGDVNSRYYSGISGFSASTTKTREILIDAIANGNCAGCDPAGHSFSQYLSTEDIDLLAEFIQNIPTQEAYNAALSSTNISNGQTVFKSTTPGHCEGCHGVDGKSIPIVDVPAVANTNPQEFLHKVQYGHPGPIMIPGNLGFLGLSLSDAGDVLAYSKTLNATNNTTPSYETASVQRGGRLYDKWWVEMRANDPNTQAPTGINPFFTIGQNSGNLPALLPGEEDKSWRCKTCHAWDYKGVGFLTGAPSDTGGDNLLYKVRIRSNETFANNPVGLQEHFFNWIKLGYNTPNHNFGVVTADNTTPLQDQDVWDLVKFLLEGGLVASENYLLASGDALAPNLTNGEGLYNGSINPDINCSVCHGIDGNTPPGGAQANPLDIFAIAAASNNPWEFAHKTRFGQPGTSMPGTTGIPSLTDKDAYDILGYAQQRFNQRPVNP